MKFKIKKIVFISVLICIILFSICPKAFATNGNEMSISSKSGIGNTIEIVSGNTTQIKSESVADVVSYLTIQGITVNSIVNHKGATVNLTNTALIGTGYVLSTNNGDYSVIVYGDANGDGEVDAGDMKVIIDDFLGIKSATGVSKIAADVYQDGALDAADLKIVLDSFLGNLKGSILNGNNSSVPTPTPTSTGNEPKIKVGEQIITLTRDNVAEYYGKVIRGYDSPTAARWRLFYVDFDGKYGDAGKIYLKADQVKVRNLNEAEHSVIDSPEVLDIMKKMNPDWAQNDGIVDKHNEKGVLWLCDESNWSNYKNSEKADYIIGAPSIEMYLDSYNAYHIKKGTNGYEEIKCKWRSNFGYNYAVGTINNTYINNTADNSLIVDENKMYVQSGQYWWLSSPCNYNYSEVGIVDGVKNKLNESAYDWEEVGECPVVILKPGVILEIVG